MTKLEQIFSTILAIPAQNMSDDISPDNTATWDSLNSIILVTEIEKAFNLKFTYDEVMAVKNFGGAKALVASKGVNADEPA